MARQTARSDIRYDGTTEETWEPPTLADYAAAMGLEEVNTTGDLTAEQKRRIAAMTLMGEARASRFDELQSYPVVEADGRLNRNALDAARRLRGQSNDPEGIERVTRQLLNEEFDAGIERPRAVRAEEVPDVDITVPEKVVNAAQAALDAKEEYGLGDCGTGRGEERARQIIQGDLKPEDFVTRERGTSIPTYLNSHSEDAPSTDAPPTDWTEEEWTDGCGPVQLALWGYYLNWAQSQEQKIRDAMDSRATRMHGGVEQPFAVFDTAIMGDAAGQEGYFYPCYLSKERADAASFTGGCHEHNFESFNCSIYMPDEPMTHAGDEAPAMPVYHSEAAMRSAGQIQTRADVSDLSEGDYVRWDSSGGTAYGMIDTIAMGETISGSLEPSDAEHETSESNPGILIQLVEREDGEIEGETEDGQKATVFHRPGTLTKISEDDIPERALEITREALGLRGDMQEKMQRMDEMTSEVSRMAEDMRKMYVGEEDEEMSAPAVKKSAADSVARHCRDNQKTYQRDFASWDGPSSKVTRASTGDRVDVTINSRAEDRHGTIILPRGARLERYNNDNPVVLINHNHDLPAGVSTVSVRESGEPVLQAQQRKDEWHTSDPRIEPWFEKVMGEPQIVRSASIGAMFHEVVPGRDYDGIERLVDTDGRDPRDLPDVVTDWSLVEWSWVTVPSNPEANVTENGQRSLSHDFYDQNTSVPSNASRSRPSPQGRDEPPAEGSDLDEPSDDGTQRSLSTEQAKVLLRDTISEEIDRRTGRK